MRLKKAFTMAEAILVMTILGIIAAVMLTTLKPAEFKEKGLRLLAKKVLSEIDTSTTQVLTNKSKLGKTDQLIDTTGTFSWKDTGTDIAERVLDLYRNYIVTIRTEVEAESFCRTGQLDSTDTSMALGVDDAAYLKDGACIGIVSGGFPADKRVLFPGEELSTTDPTKNQMTSTAEGEMLGLILVDTNGNDEPNIAGQDRFVLPINAEGIAYDAEAR